jgi:hypothetical protein
VKDPEPSITSRQHQPPEIVTTFKPYEVKPMPKQNAAVQFLREELTEERTDRIIQYLGNQAKKALPDLPVEVAEKVLDFLLPEKFLDIVERVLDE